MQTILLENVDVSDVCEPGITDDVVHLGNKTG